MTTIASVNMLPFIVLVAAYGVLCYLDFRLTREALRLGGRELNPLYGRKGERLWLFWVLHGLLIVVLAWAAWAGQWFRHGSLALYLLAGVVALRAYVVARNRRAVDRLRRGR